MTGSVVARKGHVKSLPDRSRGLAAHTILVRGGGQHPTNEQLVLPLATAADTGQSILTSSTYYIWLAGRSPWERRITIAGQGPNPDLGCGERYLELAIRTEEELVDIVVAVYL
jgi:hypothetical protein